MRPFGQAKGRGLANRPAIVSVLDIGSTKICCLVARLTPAEPGQAFRGRTHSIEVLGFWQQRSQGIKSGVVTNLDAAEQAVRQVVDAAERMAGVTVESLIVSVSGGRLASEAAAASVTLGDQPIADGDIGRVLAAARRPAATAGRAVVHSLPIGYRLDGEGGIADPHGMIAGKLGVDMHVVTADQPQLRNIELCLNRSHLTVEAMVAAPYASGLSVLVNDEAELGCAVVDFGGGTTTIAVFNRGEFVHVDALAMGGQHITTDIARGLSTRIEDAERLKTMHGSALPGVGDTRDVISVPGLDDEDRDAPDEVPRATLTRIIRPRIEEILELVRDRLNASGFASLFGRRLILTGGASQLTGLSEAARRILARNVRLGRPLGIGGMPEVARGPGFATAVGLLIYPQVAEIERLDDRAHALPMTGTDGYFGRIGQWFRESF